MRYVILLAAGFTASTVMAAPETPAAVTAATPELEVRIPADRLVADAREEIARAQRELEGGREKSALRRYRLALDHVEAAVERDEANHEAWTLIGHAAWKLGDQARALAAYGRSLSLKPDYAPARRELGEAYLELGKPRHAREQAEWLERLGEPDLARRLERQIEIYELAHPQAGSPVKRDSTQLPLGPRASL